MNEQCSDKPVWREEFKGYALTTPTNTSGYLLSEIHVDMLFCVLCKVYPCIIQILISLPQYLVTIRTWYCNVYSKYLLSQYCINTAPHSFSTLGWGGQTVRMLNNQWLSRGENRAGLPIPVRRRIKEIWPWGEGPGSYYEKMNEP